MTANQPDWTASARSIGDGTALKKPELEQAIIRLALGCGLIGYYLYGTWHTALRKASLGLPSDLVMAAWLVVCIGIVIAIRYGKPYSIPRRMIAITADVCNTTYFIYVLPDLAAPLFCLYLWFIIGNGFRFGVSYLYYTLALSFAGFTVVVLTQPYWHDKFGLGLGLALGMAAISVYLATLVHRLRNALESAEAANLAKRRFVSSVSHEIRTPLNAIIGMADLLKSTSLSRDQHEMVRSLDGASKLLLGLVNDVLDFSKIEAGKLTLESASFNLTAIIEDTLGLFRYQAAEKGLTLEIDMQRDVPVGLVGDATLLRQILANFLSNAIKFTADGKVTLRVSALTVRADDAQLLFEVEDTGIGIPPDAKARIFDSFTQADASTTRKYGGTGLGTTIAKQLVELMGGRIGFRSVEFMGTTFWFELRFPLHQTVTVHEAVTATTLPPAPESFPVPRDIDTQYAVLVAEDNETNRKVIGKILERAGHRATIVADGEAALDFLEREAFDIAILDMNMPDMSGMDVFDTYAYLRPPAPRPPFIMLSADVTQDLQKECLDAGFDAFLSKPIQSDTLLGTIKDLVERRRRVSGDKPAADSVATATIDTATSRPAARLLDFSALEQIDRLSQDREFVNSLISDFLKEAEILINQIEVALLQQRPAESKRIAHALKGGALSVGAVGLCSLCERIDTLPVAAVMEDGHRMVAGMREVLGKTGSVLAPYRTSRLRVVTQAHLH